MQVILDLNRMLLKAKQLQKDKDTLVICIDGGGGAGKSTLARKISQLDHNCTVIQMDDFYKPKVDLALVSADEIGGNWDWRRVQSQVLEPLSLGLPGRYQVYDWDHDRMAEWREVPVGGIAIVEGCYSLRREFSHLSDLKIWVESPRSLRLARGIERDGVQNQHLWTDVWMPAEDRYMMTQDPIALADVVLDGTGDKADICYWPR